eukprot:8305055-Pyramimonas_sp.AAC.1
MRLGGVEFDARQLGEPWKEARVMELALGDEPLLAADSGQGHGGALDAVSYTHLRAHETGAYL